MNRISQSPHESLARSTSQNFYEHLDELRHALVKIILAVLFTTVISYYFVDNVL